MKKPKLLLLSAAMAMALSACDTAASDPMQAAEQAFEENRFRDARIHLLESLKQSPNAPEANLLYAEILINLGDYLGAQTALAKIPETSNAFLQSQILRSKALTLDGKSEEALTFIAGIDVEGLSAEQKSLLSWSKSFSLLNLARVEEAIATWDAALALDPKNIDLLTLKARYYFESSDLEQAKSVLGKALESDPKSYEALQLSGRIAMLDNDLAAAKTTFETIRENYPDAIPPIFALASIAYDEGDYEQSRKYIDQLLAIGPDDGRAILLLARLEFAEGNIDKTLGLLQKVDSFSAELPLALLLKGKTALARNNYELAEESLTKFLASEPNDEEGLIALAKTFEATNRQAEAMRLLEPVIRNAQASEEALTYVAKLSAKTGDQRSASLANRAKIAGKGDISAEMIKAEEAIKRGEWAAAGTVYANLRANGHGTNPLVLNNSAMVALQGGDVANAEAFARQALAVAPQDPMILDTLGWILLSKGTANQEAFQLIQSAAKLLPNHRGIKSHLARAYRVNGDVRAAERLEAELRG
ncbi:tetratricopeptide repeat protein [Parasphingorhabdus sp. DH2-15]|uniref:tetratricopeptide repeat protein n=1 Tax=Parasphingorhabdus sp. DH2-15 TaxID=3444112 RepID=UPI003F682648